MEGQARAARLRRGPRRPRAAAPTTPTSRTPASSGRTSSATRRRSSASRRSSSSTTFMQPTWQALIDGAKYCEPQLREIIAPVSSPTSSSRTTSSRFPALRHRRARRSSGSCRATRSRCQGPDVAAGLLRAAGRRPERVGGVPRRVRPDPPRDVGRRSTRGSVEQGAPAAAGPRVHPRRRTRRTSTSTRRRPTTRTGGRSTRRGTASTRASAQTDDDVELPAAAGRPARRAARSSTSRSARWAAPTST